MEKADSHVSEELLRIPTWRQKIPAKATPLLVLLVLQLFLNLGIATFLEVKQMEFAGPVIGSVFSQIVLFAVWCALAPIHFGTRYLAGTTAFTVTAVCMYRCAQRDGGGDAIALTITGAMLAQWLLYQVPLWHTRWKGWYLSAQDSESAAQTSNELQFGIAQLFLWTTIVAVLLGALRVLATVFGDGIQSSVDFNLFPTMALGNTLLVLPLIYACFSRDNMPLWLIIALVWAIGVSVAQAMVARATSGFTGFLLLINIFQFIAVLVSLMLVRRAGVRLRR